jgi:hypothetical protein
MANYDDVLEIVAALLERVSELESERLGAQRDLDNLTREVLGLRSEVQALRANLKTLRTQVEPLMLEYPQPLAAAGEEPDVQSLQTFRLERDDFPGSVRLPESGPLDGEPTGRRPTPVPPMENVLTPVQPPDVGDDESTSAFNIDATSVRIQMEDDAEDPSVTASSLQRFDPPTMDSGEFDVEETSDAVIETSDDHDVEPDDEHPTGEARVRAESWVEDPTKVNIELPERGRKGGRLRPDTGSGVAGVGERGAHAAIDAIED